MEKELGSWHTKQNLRLPLPWGGMCGEELTCNKAVVDEAYIRIADSLLWGIELARLYGRRVTLIK